jgi:hypothetical protein
MIRKVIWLLCVLWLLLTGTTVFAQDLSIEPGDLQFEQRSDGGFHLFVRKKPDIASVLLTESTRDPTMRAHNYAYRALEWNQINGDEIRLLNGFPIPRESRIYSLISSTPVPHPELGEAFHIFIPWVVHYGYVDARHGAVLMTDGTYINIRAFNLPYADYRGNFADNPFILQAVQVVPEELKGQFLAEAVESFREIARQGNGDFVYASSSTELIEVIENLLLKEAGKAVDIVICLDTTGSMAPYIDEVRRMLVPMLREIIADFTGYRIGMVLYRDYPPDIYITKLIPFTRDFNLFQRNLNAVVAWGGGDIPEAVYEALYDGVDKFPWEAESRVIILIGDAPPHPEQRGLISREMVFEKAAEKGIIINTIVLPNA